MNKINESKKTVLELKGLVKTFGDVQALKGVDLDIKEGEFVTLLGPSGCGKSTTLRMLAGFEEPTEGQILLDGQRIAAIPAYKRPINTVFQDYSLFPHFDVLGNLLFPLKNNKELKVKTKSEIENRKAEVKKLNEEISTFKEEIKALNITPETVTDKNRKELNDKENVIGLEISSRMEKIIDLKDQGMKIKDVFRKMAFEALEKVGLKGYEKRSVDKLSGGQKQRVAIARAIVNKPRVLLLDEPLGALDKKLRNQLQWELKQLQVQTGITFVFVTHDQEEAMVMSDRVVVMNNGFVEQVDTPVGVYEEPINKWVADFIGDSNIIEDAKYVGDKLVKWDGNTFKCVDRDFKKGEAVDVVIRPEDIILKKSGESDLKGKIASKVFKGITYEYDVECEDGREYLVQTTDSFNVEDEVKVVIKPNEIHVMEKMI